MLETLADFNLSNLIWMAGGIFAAAVLRAFTGFGFALAALPLLSLFLAPGTAASIIVLLTLIVSVQTFRSYARDVEFKPMVPMLVLLALGTGVGTYILLIIAADTFKIVIGVTVMVACFLLSLYKPSKSQTGGVKSWAAGFSSGLLNGALAIPGPPVIVYAMAVFPEPKKSRAFLMMFFLFSATFAAGSYATTGIIGVQELVLTLAASPAMLAGDKLGFWLFGRYGKAAYRNTAIAVLFAIGASVTATALF